MNELTPSKYRKEDEILFFAAAAQNQEKGKHRGTCFAGMGKVCDKSLTPDPQKAERLRKQNFW